MDWTALDLPRHGMVFFSSLAITLLLVLTKRHHLSLTTRSGDRTAVQAAHKVPTPRVGGIGIAMGLSLGFIVAMDEAYRLSALLFVLSGLPVFLVGLLEDMGVAMRPRYRLAAAAVSSLCVIGLLGVWLPRLDLPLLDTGLAIAPIAIVFTVFAATGVCHAMNLIDGLNGLAGLIGITISIALALLAFNAGDTLMANGVLLIVPALLGFLIFNYPRGAIFLGDAGAYLLGHVLAWMAIFIVWRNLDVSPWAVLLVFFWPVADTLFAIYRRRRIGKPSDQPDRLHFHQLVMRAAEIGFLGRGQRALANPLATLLMVPFFVAPAAAGVLLWNSSLAAGLMVIVFAALYVATYNAGVRLARRRFGLDLSRYLPDRLQTMP